MTDPDRTATIALPAASVSTETVLPTHHSHHTLQRHSTTHSSQSDLSAVLPSSSISCHRRCHQSHLPPASDSRSPRSLEISPIDRPRGVISHTPVANSDDVSAWQPPSSHLHPAPVLVPHDPIGFETHARKDHALGDYEPPRHPSVRWGMITNRSKPTRGVTSTSHYLAGNRACTWIECASVRSSRPVDDLIQVGPSTSSGESWICTDELDGLSSESWIDRPSRDRRLLDLD